MIHKNPMHDVDNPPGQITLRDLNGGRPVKYLRDIIKKYQDEDETGKVGCTYPACECPNNACEPSEQRVAPYPCDNAEKRLARLKQALLRAIQRGKESYGEYHNMVSIWALEDILEENT